MAHTIEQAVSGRAKCRKCKEMIEKGTWRFGYEADNEFGTSYQWFHLNCAAEKLPIDLAKTLEGFSGDLPDRAELDELIQKNRSKQKPTTFPYAEVAPTGRSTCLVCEAKIEKGELRVAVQREVDAGGFTRKTAGYLHPKCCSEYDEIPDDLAAQLEANSISLEADQLAAVTKEL